MARRFPRAVLLGRGARKSVSDWQEFYTSHQNIPFMCHCDIPGRRQAAVGCFDAKGRRRDRFLATSHRHESNRSFDDDSI